jgi:hypothetical protein
VVDRTDEAGGGGGLARHPPGTGDRPVRPDGRGGCFGQGPVRSRHARRIPTRLPAGLRRRQRRPHLQPGGQRLLPDPAGGGRAGGNGRASLQCGTGHPDAERRRQVRSRTRPRLAGGRTRAALSDGGGVDRRAGAAGGAPDRDHRMVTRQGRSRPGSPVSELDGTSSPR